MATNETKRCRSCGADFVIDAEDFSFYERVKVPPPTWCPWCRTQRRMAFWSEHNLFCKKDAATGKAIFSGYPEAAPIKIYEHNYWWSDKWDPLQYGREYDLSRPFFEQFRELMLAVPWPARSVHNMVVSDYCDQAGDLKNCYLCFNCAESSDCLYGVAFLKMRNCMDFYQAADSELCYEIFSCERAYQTFFSVECDDSRNVWFSQNCEDCSDCFGCMNLRHKKYHVWNEPYSKDEYFKKLKEFNLGSYKALTGMKQRTREFWLKFPFRYAHEMRNTNVIGGEYVYRSKNVRYSYQGLEMENVRYSQNMARGIYDSWDYTNWGNNAELVYESANCGTDISNIKFCFDCWPVCENLEYSMCCRSSSNLFGCVGLKKKQYCILNKEYPKAEYEKLRKKIIRQMEEMPYTDKMGRDYRYGEFFPPEFSPLAYNESAAGDYLPLTKEEALAKGFTWREPGRREFKVTMDSGDLPDHIKDVKPEICKEVIACASCKRAYRIVAAELTFYNRFGLPLPRLCHECRYEERIKFRNPPKWYKRRCMRKSCPREFETSYPPASLRERSDALRAGAPDRPEIIYCDKCYRAEVM